jgi:hypothetical protein
LDIEKLSVGGFTNNFILGTTHPREKLLELGLRGKQHQLLKEICYKRIFFKLGWNFYKPTRNRECVGQENNMLLLRVKSFGDQDPVNGEM